jgi:hypothetical protein
MFGSMGPSMNTSSLVAYTYMLLYSIDVSHGLSPQFQFSLSADNLGIYLRGNSRQRKLKQFSLSADNLGIYLSGKSRQRKLKLGCETSIGYKSRKGTHAVGGGLLGGHKIALWSDINRCYPPQPSAPH